MTTGIATTFTSQFLGRPSTSGNLQFPASYSRASNSRAFNSRASTRTRCAATKSVISDGSDRNKAASSRAHGKPAVSRRSRGAEPAAAMTAVAGPLCDSTSPSLHTVLESPHKTSHDIMATPWDWDTNEQQSTAPSHVQPKAAHESVASKLCNAIERWLNATVKAPPSRTFLEGSFAPVENENGPITDLPITGHLPECLNGVLLRNGPNPRFTPTFNYHLFDGDGCVPLRAHGRARPLGFPLPSQSLPPGFLLPSQSLPPGFPLLHLLPSPSPRPPSMLHSVRMKHGKASYVNRYVRTSRFTQEDAHQRAMFLKLSDLVGYAGLGRLLLEQLRCWLGVLDRSQGNGTANTALVFHAGRLLALYEADAPYVIEVKPDGDLETKGRMTYDGRLTHPFTAHPKVDPVTGELFTFGCEPDARYLTYRVVSKAGEMGPPVRVSIPAPTLMHDFAITENHAVFLDLPLEFTPREVINNKMPFLWNPDRLARFGVLPRYAESEAEMRWFELPPLFIFHTVNAWEEQAEGGETEVVLIASLQFFTLMLPLPLPMLLPTFHVRLTHASPARLTHASHSRLRSYEFRFNLATGKASQRQLTSFSCDFPCMHGGYTGRKQRYVYCATFEGENISGVVKVDLSKSPDLSAPHPAVSGCISGLFKYGTGRFGSEPVFVPRSDEPGAEEDDGYVLSFVYDSNTDASEVVVLDARSLAPQPVATIHLPQRVPAGIHGIFVSEDQLTTQISNSESNAAVHGSRNWSTSRRNGCLDGQLPLHALEVPS
ncbi:unnamed protein product [Closterium sp. Yama58-4]|nr:unnamed protein product [Closterium sp. Yama58-4]